LGVREVLQRLGRGPLEPDELQGQRVVGQLGNGRRCLGSARLRVAPSAAAVVTAAAGRQGRGHHDRRRRQPHRPAWKGRASPPLYVPHLFSCFLGRVLLSFPRCCGGVPTGVAELLPCLLLACYAVVTALVPTGVTRTSRRTGSP